MLKNNSFFNFFKQILFFTVFLMIALILTSINANAEVSNSEKITFLVQKGATEKILEKLPQDKLDTIYNRVLEEDLTCKSYTNTVTKEIPSDCLTRGAIDPSEIELKCTADFYVKSNNTISWAVLSYQGKWDDGKPFVKSTDGVTFNWDSNKFVCDLTEFYAEYYPVFDDKYAYVAYSIDNPSQAALQGLAYYLDLSKISSTGNPNLPDTDAKNIGFSGIVELMPNDTIVANKNTYFGVTLNYAHNKNPLPVGLSFNVKGVNIAIDSGALVDTIGEHFSFKLE